MGCVSWSYYPEAEEEERRVGTNRGGRFREPSTEQPAQRPVFLYCPDLTGAIVEVLQKNPHLVWFIFSHAQEKRPKRCKQVLTALAEAMGRLPDNVRLCVRQQVKHFPNTPAAQRMRTALALN